MNIPNISFSSVVLQTDRDGKVTHRGIREIEDGEDHIFVQHKNLMYAKRNGMHSTYQGIRDANVLNLATHGTVSNLQGRGFEAFPMQSDIINHIKSEWANDTQQ